MLETKRPIVLDEYLESAFYSPDAHDAKKPHSKPGRKPAEGEPKLKRTAQNRAAQRAYRERKERKMLDLENKVKELELETVQAHTKSDFLQAQVAMLESELARYRGHGDLSDLRLPNKVGDLKTLSLPSYQTPLPSNKPAGLFDNQHGDFVADFPWSRHNLNNAHKQASSIGSTTNSMVSSSPNDALVSPDSSVLSGRVINSKHATDGVPVGKFDEKLDKFCTELNQACGTVSCPIPEYKRSDSNPTTLRPSPMHSLTNSSSIPQYLNSERGSVSGVSGRAHLDMYKLPLSSLMSPNSHTHSEAGHAPVLLAAPKTHAESWLGTSPAFPSGTESTPLSSYDHNTSAANLDFLADPMFSGVGDFDFSDITAPNPFSNDGNFDAALAFSQDAPVENKAAYDPLSLLIDEESAYDPFTPTSQFKLDDGRPKMEALLSIENTRAKAPTSDNDNDSEDEVVPAPDQQVQCSEIWDRITSHARYTEIDIDGLCMELKAKAKCSERGVVVNSKELDRIIQEKMSV